ncbi:MAG: DUF2846 domain-containing protein [Candidatus Omnitrophota bacterium]
MKNIKLLSLLVVLMFLFGCATLQVQENPYASGYDDSKGLIYILRDNSFIGSGGSIFLEIDDQIIGATNSGTYFAYEVEPRKLKITATGNGCREEFVVLDVSPGTEYFIKAWFSSSMSYGMQVLPLPEGKALSQKLRYGALSDEEIQKINKKRATGKRRRDMQNKNKGDSRW